MPPTDEETCCSRTTGISDQVLLEIVSKRRLFGNRSDGYFENSWTNFRLPKIIIRFIIFFLLFLCTVNYKILAPHYSKPKHKSHEPRFFSIFFFSNKFLNVFLSYNHLFFNSATRQTCIDKVFFSSFFSRFLVQADADKVQPAKYWKRKV